MSKIMEYDEVAELLEDNMFMIDGNTTGTKIITADNVAKEFFRLVPITDLSEITSLEGSELLLVDDGTGKKAITAENAAKGLAMLSSIEDLSEASTFHLATKFVISTGSGNKKITAERVANRLMDFVTAETFFELMDEVLPPAMHRMIYRGKNLGTSYTSTQHNRVASGNFHDIWLGDYWEIEDATLGPIKYVVADFDYWLGTGVTPFAAHHIVVIPETSMYSDYMNEYNADPSDYYHSIMRGGDNGISSGHLADAYSAFYAAFGNSLLTHKEILCSRFTADREFAGVWYDSTVEIPTENMIFGNNAGISAVPLIQTSSRTQLALMAVSPTFISVNSDAYWLRYQYSSDRYCVVENGVENTLPMSWSTGIRPVAAIG